MKKKIIIILFNIIFFLILFFILNAFFEKKVYSFDNYPRYLTDVREPEALNPDVETEEYTNDFVRLAPIRENYLKFCGEKKLIYGEEYMDKKPIIVLGCSYTFGHGLKREETFAARLSDYLERPVYSFSDCGWELHEGFKNMMEYRDKSVIKNSEYFIYIYMHDHINRFLQQPLFMELEEMTKINKKSFPNNIFLIRYIKSCIRFKALFYKDGISSKNEKIHSLLKQIILNHYKKIKAINPDAKFIIILYNEKIPTDIRNINFVWNMINSHIWDELDKEDDIIVVRTKDIMGFSFDKDYKLKADYAFWHPSERVWREFTPKFADKYIKQ